MRIYLCGAGDRQADAQVIDRELQEESAEGLGAGLLYCWQFVHHLFGGHMNVWVESQALFLPVIIGSLIVQPEQNSYNRHTYTQLH